MAMITGQMRCQRSDGFSFGCWAAHWLVVVLLIVLPGCGGCGKTPDAEEMAKAAQAKQDAEKAKKLKEKKEGEPFEAKQPTAQPTSSVWAGAVKPGHQFSYVLPDVKANRGDFQGELVTDVVDRQNRPVPIVATPYEMTTLRTAVLAKEQPKSLEAVGWIPANTEAGFANCTLAAGRGGSAVIQRSMALHRMPSYQYFFIVLAKATGRYDYLEKKLDSIRMKRSNQDDTTPGHYQVVQMPSRGRPNLPTHAFCWTSIAYLLWDDADPTRLDLEQQRALVDWLHWGGQIIVSGPDTLQTLHNSFLGPYLPATVGKARKLAAIDLKELQYWAGDNGNAITPVQPWAGAELKKVPQAEFLNDTNDLVVERPVGRGRIVASAFRLTGPELIGWQGYDDFFNACLLRRPPRMFAYDATLDCVAANWSHQSNPAMWLDAAKTTAVRYFTRDAGAEFKHYASDIGTVSEPESIGAAVDGISAPDDDSQPSVLGERNAAGLAAWNDFSPIAQAARKALANATGINVPDRSFIVWVVVGYLGVLVPANWIVFRLLGRVEWAWIAAPPIAVICTFAVIEQAQLNVGFARSQNEIAVVELQPDYPRAHLTRYSALYTSLATQYEVKLSDPGGMVVPFPSVASPERFQMPMWQSRRSLVCRRGDETSLSGMSVASNFVEFLHSEEMVDFGGTMALGRDANGTWRVTNRTKHDLKECNILRCTVNKTVNKTVKQLQLAMLERLAAGESEPLTFKAFTTLSPHAAEGADNAVKRPSGALGLTGLVDVAMHRQELRSDEVCLIATVADGVLPLHAEPSPPQSRQAVLLVAHLASGQPDAPRADYNLREQVQATQDDADAAPKMPVQPAVRPPVLPKINVIEE